MHLIRALAIVRSVNCSDDASLPKQVEQLLATPEPGLSFFDELHCLDRVFVEQLVSILETLARRAEAPSFLGRADYMNEEAVFRRVLLARGANQEDGLTLDDWVMFYAWCAFLLRFSNDLGSYQVRAFFNDWIRVVRNLVNNSDIDRNERLVAALRGLAQLSQNCGADFLSRVANGALDESGGFNQQQQRLYAMLSLRHFRLARSRSLSLGAGAPRRARRIDREHDPRWRPFRFRKNRRCSTGASRRFRFRKFRCGPIDGARAVELFAATGSLHIGAGRQRTGRAAPFTLIAVLTRAREGERRQ